jgi:hypothetical protein
VAIFVVNGFNQSVDKMSQTAKEIAVISKPGSVEEQARLDSVKAISSAFGEGATNGATKSMAGTNSVIAYLFPPWKKSG